MHVSDLIRAGGSLEDAAYRGQAELTRYEVVDGDTRQTELITVNLAAIRRGDPGADLPLKPYDTLVIKPIPMWMEPGVDRSRGRSAISRASIRFTRARPCIRCCCAPADSPTLPSPRGRVHSRGAEEAREGAAGIAGQPAAKRSGRLVARGDRRAAPSPTRRRRHGRESGTGRWANSSWRNCARPNRSGAS